MACVQAQGLYEHCMAQLRGVEGAEGGERSGASGGGAGELGWGSGGVAV